MNRHEKKRQQKHMNNLFNEYTLKFTKQELIAIANNLLMMPDGSPTGRARTYTPGEGHIIHTLLEKIRPLVEDAKAPKPEEETKEPEPVIIGTDADQDKEDTTN